MKKGGRPILSCYTRQATIGRVQNTEAKVRYPVQDTERTSLPQTVMIKMIGNNYSLECARTVINQLAGLSEPVAFLYKYKNKVTELWNKGYVMKTVVSPDVTKYEKNKPFLNREVNDSIKFMILRLFYDFKNPEGALPPIFVTYSSHSGGNPTYVQSVTPFSDDYRRTVFGITAMELTPSGDIQDKYYVLKLSKAESYTRAYVEEGKVYDALVSRSEVVKCYGHGSFTFPSSDSSVYTFGNTDGAVQLSIDKTYFPEGYDTSESDPKYYLLLENTVGYYDYEDYLKLIAEDKVSESFDRIFNTLLTVSNKTGFYHGDFHNNNVKINDKNVKLFDFDYAGVLNKTDLSQSIISSNILHYSLQMQSTDGIVPLFIEDRKNVVVNTKGGITNTILKNYLFLFDVFRMWLSACLTLNKSFHFSFKDLSNVCNNWINSDAFDNDWHSYFMKQYFFNHIYIKMCPAIRQNDEECIPVTKPTYRELPELTRLNNRSGDTLRSVHKTLSWKSEDGQSLTVYGDDSATVRVSAKLYSFLTDGTVYVTDEDLKKSLAVGGGRKKEPKYRLYGKYSVLLNGRRSVRRVWTYNRQLFVKRQNGVYEKINKKSLSA